MWGRQSRARWFVSRQSCLGYASIVPSVSEISRIVEKLVGRSVGRPSGTLSGHAAGLPFEKLVHQEVLNSFPKRTYRHFELLNVVFESNPESKSAVERNALLGPPSLQFLLKRGVDATECWTVSSPFEEKQNDTAETVILPLQGWKVEPLNNEPVVLLDVKTQNSEMNAQPPNIISARKMMQACRLVLEHSTECPFNFVYVGVKWREVGSTLICTEVNVSSLLRVPPPELYINWAAALQIQFHPATVSQDFEGSPMDWCADFLETYALQLERRLKRDNLELAELKSFIANRRT